MKVSAKNITESLKKKSFPVFKGDYNLTLVGVRSADTDSNKFNDVLVVLYEVDKKQHCHIFPMTSDPGIYYREDPINLDGTAVLVPGRYKSCWKLGAHRGQYRALVQSGEMAVYRDNNYDSEIDVDEDSIKRGLFGINLHRANKNQSSLQVDKWSAGCQVLANPIDFDLLMALVNKSSEKYGDKFSYVLLTEKQL